MTTGARTRRGVLKGAVALAALAALPARAQEKVELIFSNFLANSTETPNVQAALKRYREKYPDVTVTEQTASHDEYLTQFNVGAASGEVPDVFMLNGSDTTSIVNAGLMGDITKDFYDDAEWGGLTPKSMTFEFTRDDKVYGVPYGQIITHVIYWNEDIFKKNGIDGFPATWKDFLAAVDTLRAAGITPISLGNKGRWVVVDPYMSTLGYRHTGGEFVQDMYAGKDKLNGPEYVAAISNMQELVQHDAFNPDLNSLDNQQQRAAYYAGEAAMFVEGSWAIPGVNKEAKPEVLAATRMAIWPEIDGKADYANLVSGGAGWAFCIAARLEGAKREAAVNLLRELSSVDYSRSRLEIGLLPAQNLGAKADGIKLDPLLATLVDTLNKGTWVVAPITPTNMPRSFLDLEGQLMQDMMVGNATPQEVGDRLQKDFEDATR